ncbi:MAG: 30S ribosomal protein S12 methylthiotransferase RimO [Candidatus Aminicenantes bacterium]|nr:30S ribosomal protein S12 methylthiotransferase RimO [Candidatus Aminicenantes bacterium]
MTRPTRGAPGGRRALKKIALISLGCAKNLVDSEVMLGALKKSGFVFVTRVEDADVVIVNTCGFIGPARMEAEETLRTVLRLKEKNPRIRIVAAGCYVERDRTGLQKKFPGIDAWTGVRSFDRIAAIVRGQPVSGPDRTFLYSDRSPRLVSTPGTWAYVKVSEGCSHRCGFCAIPLIKGPYVSRSMASVVREVQTLAGLGVKEIDLISHDTTWFGRDRGLGHGLVRLLERLVRTSGVEWIRFLYGYPGEITDPLLEVMADPKICRYFDIPFQHSDPGLIKAMKRGLDGARALRLLERIREKLPGAAVRTSLIVGFPGEGRREFAGLEDFVRAARFDHLGVFTYSPERGTEAFGRPDKIGAAEKERRRGAIMVIQAGLSLERNKAYIGKQIEVLVERHETGDPRFWLGRGRFQAPEVDGVIRFTLPPGMTAPPSPIIQVEITSAGAYDLDGRLVP